MIALRRPAGVDVAAAALTAAVVVPVLGSGWSTAATALAVVGTFVDVAALLLVRTSPVAATAAVAIATTLPGLSLGPGLPVWPLLALLVGLHGGHDVVLAVGFALSLGVVGWSAPPGFTVGFVATTVLVTAVFWALGRLRRVARERDERRYAAAERVRQAELVGAERRRIADELGAVVL
uniref:hypothetical protein n=1 Tax=Pseudonocardia pini TaxID=2758030 RepID=UPI001C68BE0A